MKLLSIFTLLCLFSFNSYAEKCEGVNACSDLYSKLTGQKLSIDPTITDEMTLASPDVDLTKENAKVEFSKFINKNVMSILDKTKLISHRMGEFLTAPIYVVSENNIPMMINKDGLVTFVYHTKGNTKKLADKTRIMMSKKMPRPHSANKIVEYKENKIIVVSDTYEKADKIAREWIKLDK
jgi:hypothetical protein